MIWTLWILIKSLFKKKEINKSPKFKVGYCVTVVTSKYLPNYVGMEGLVLEVVEHSIDNWIYQIEIKMETDYSHVQYFNENELDYPLWKKRDDRLKELGI